MNVDVQKKVKIIQKSMDSIRKMDKTVHTISFSRLADEIEMPLSELTDIFLDIEDMFLNEQKRVIRKMMELIEKGLKNCNTPNDAKELLETTTIKLIELLPDYSDLVYSAIFYLPKCLAERERAKKYYRQALRKIIKKGWPGKIESVLDRQTDLVLFSFYGYMEYIVRANKSERKEIQKDYINMINLHLQDRLFF
tara:strand:- start:160 stop:744 length:585 start_codon:yes stop_codon:yes gene_type:complete